MEKVYRTVIIDDEESAIDNLCFELQRYTYISIEGKARNGAAGIKMIERFHPDLVFLDVELPDMQGMDVVSKLEGYVSWNMNIVFYTAHDKYVIDALRAKAFDFLLKPVDSEELQTVILRLCKREYTVPNYTPPMLPDTGKPFVVTTPTGDLRFLHTSEIGYFRYQSARKIWEVALTNGTFLPLKRNTTAEQLCAYDKAFAQIHQSYIINMHYLVMVQDNHCIMYPPFNSLEEELQVSKKYRKKLIDCFYQL